MPAADEHNLLEADSTGAVVRSPAFEPLRTVIAEADESQRYQIFAALLSELAEQTRNGRSTAGAQQFGAASIENRQLREEVARLKDELRETTEQLETEKKQREVDAARQQQLRRTADEQRAKAEDVEKRLAAREVELTARNNELHQARNEIEQFTLEAQRLKLAAADRSLLDRAEQQHLRLAEQLEQLRSEFQQVRDAKDAEISRLKVDAARTGSAGPSGDELLSKLWQRLANAKLVEGHVPPNVQAFERLVDLFIHLVNYVGSHYSGIVPFLDEATKRTPAVKVPWDQFKRLPDWFADVGQSLSPKTLKPVGPLRMRLSRLQAFTQAMIFANDTVIRRLHEDLKDHVKGRLGPDEKAPWDQNSQIRVYLQHSGEDDFLARTEHKRGELLRDLYGRDGGGA